VALADEPMSELDVMQAVLEAREIRKSFGGVHALKGVSLSLKKGEVHALAGENGAGKSTLIKILAGAIQPDSGHIYLDGQLLTHHSPRRARTLGIGIVYQQPALLPDLTVAENIALAGESESPWRRVNWKYRRHLAESLLERVGAHFSENALAGSLTAPQQQLVEIAKALDAKPAVLILDEPTATLGEQDAENLFRIVRELQAQHTSIVYITHRFDELFRLADRVTILRDGQRVDTCPVHELTRNRLVSLMVGREVSAVFPKRTSEVGKAALEVKHLACKSNGVKDVSLTVHCGEIVGLAGLIGSGRTQFAECVFGLTQKDSGEILVEGQPVEMRSPREAIDHCLGYVPEDRRKHGLILEMTIAANTTLSSLSKISQYGFLKPEIETQSAGDFSRRMHVKAPSVHTIAGNLSGGNQQKVALSRWLMTEPKVLILDEPTQGIDVGAKAEIYALMNDLAERGIAILMISSDMSEILGMSDRVVVMAKGEISGELNRSEASPESVLHFALGHKDHVLEGQGV
jgi:rhamnose transport system ATP-binding protein